MFDISWTEFLLIAIVALVFIGPKELPAVLRTVGQWTRKIRGMAAEFQSQFQEAMREAEMADLKKQVDDIAHGIKQDVTSYNPLNDVRADVEAAQQQIKSSIEEPAPPSVAPEAEQLPAPEPGQDEVLGKTEDEARSETQGETQGETQAVEDPTVVAAIAPVAPEPAAGAARPDTAEQGG
jgi:sec-independent protein translocase protein TatB